MIGAMEQMAQTDDSRVGVVLMGPTGTPEKGRHMAVSENGWVWNAFKVTHQCKLDRRELRNVLFSGGTNGNGEVSYCKAYIIRHGELSHLGGRGLCHWVVGQLCYSSVVVKSLFSNDHSDNDPALHMGSASCKRPISTY